MNYNFHRVHLFFKHKKRAHKTHTGEISVLTTGFFVSGSNSVEFASEKKHKNSMSPLFYKHYRLIGKVL